MELTRRNFVKLASMAGLVGITNVFTGCSNKEEENKNVAEADKIPPDEKAKVYFTKHIDAEHLIAIYQKVSSKIVGKVGLKIHTGEPHAPNILTPDMIQPLQAQIPNSAIIETNTLYDGARSTTERHKKVLKTNGWTFCPVDILDEEDSVNFPVSKGFHLKEVAMGSHLTNYDSIVVLSHFKGHAMSGYGGALKNIGMGCASAKVGKTQVHGLKKFNDWVMGKIFMELLSDSGKAICEHFGNQITFINVLQRLSVDCDCAGAGAAAPLIPDLGILGSTDIVAVEKASVDMIYNLEDENKKDVIDRIESRGGLRQLSAMAEHKMGTLDYEIISID